MNINIMINNLDTNFIHSNENKDYYFIYPFICDRDHCDHPSFLL